MVAVGYIILAVAIRFLYPFILLANLHPLPIHLIAQVLDRLDFQLIEGNGGVSNETYQLYDKMNDAFYYFAVLLWLYVYRKKLWYSKVFIPLLAFRLVGNFLFLVIGLYFENIRLLLVIFPDLFTWFYALVTLYDLAKADDFLRKPIYFTLIFLTNIGFTVWAEVGRHSGDPTRNVGLSTQEIVSIFLGI